MIKGNKDIGCVPYLLSCSASTTRLKEGMQGNLRVESIKGRDKVMNQENLIYNKLQQENGSGEDYYDQNYWINCK